MSDTEVEVPVAAAPAPEVNGTSGENNELPPFDDELLIKVKGKVKRPQRPDDSERNIIVGKLQGEVVKMSERMKEIKEILDNRQKSGRTLPPEQQAIRDRLNASRQEFQTVLRQKQHIREELNSAITQRTQLRDEIRSLREKTPRGVNLDQLETRLQEIEFKMSHESVSEAEEKRMNVQLTNMNAARPMARQHALAEEKLKEVEEARAAVSKRLTDSDAVLNAIRAREDTDRATLEQLQADSKATDPQVDFGTLVVEKQECWQVITALRDKMTEIRKDFDVQYKEYIKLDKNYNAWLRHDKRAKWEQRQKERAERETEENGGDVGAAVSDERAVSEPYESEILTLEQLLRYLHKFAGTQMEAKKEEEKTVTIPDGMKPMKKKDDDDFMPVSAKKAGKGASKGTKGLNAPASDPSKKKLSHTLELLQTFMLFAIDVPNTQGELPAAIEKAEAKKADFLEKRKKKKEAPAKKEEVEESPAAESNGEKVEEAAPAVEEEKVEEAAPAVEEEEVEEAAPAVEEEVKEAAPAVEEEVEEAAPAVEEEVEEAAPAADEETVEEAASTPAVSAEVEKAEGDVGVAFKVDDSDNVSVGISTA
eukprot:gene9131-16256_t